MTDHAMQTNTVGVHLAREPRIAVMGIDYLHLRLDDGSDLYLTEYGVPWTSHLLPENHWGDKDWFRKNSVRLPGTSTLYRIKTKAVRGAAKDIVLKWNRMGQDVPGETRVTDPASAEFNSPFEEFSVVIEMRDQRGGPSQIYTHKPLGIYVPRRYVEAERTGRKRYRIEALQLRHQEITLDINRQYAVIYEWIKGIDAAEAADKGILDDDTMRELIRRSGREMSRKGFRVLDSKPHHIIVRPRKDDRDERELARDRRGNILYALVDFELLERTPEREQITRAYKRKSYLERQAHRFETKEEFPPGLTPFNVLGVDYVHGPVESTSGALWVVGRDPMLFDYFLPEKWRKTRRQRLSSVRDVYYTVTKDNIHLVWQVSRVGKRPDVEPADRKAAPVLAHGYNSPFEEIALSMELASNGIATTYPRAIYMTRHKSDSAGPPSDDRRYESHRDWLTPEGHPILSRDHDYIIIWGFWNGPDEMLAAKDEQVYRGIDALEARRQGLITEELYARTMAKAVARLRAVGIEDLSFSGSHLLLSQEMSGPFVLDEEGIPEVRLCNYELLRHSLS